MSNGPIGHGIEIAKIWSPATGGFIAIEINWNAPRGQRTKGIPDNDPRKAEALALPWTFDGFRDE